MSRKIVLAVTAAALAVGTLATTSASAGFRPGRPGHFPNSAGLGFRVPHIPINRFSNIRLPHIPLNRFSNIHLRYPGYRPFHPRWYPGYQSGGYAVYQRGGYAPAPVADYVPPAPTYVAPAPTYVAPAPVYVAPTPSYTPPPAQGSCLSKTYQQDGSVLFTDSCTGEQAAAAPAQAGS